MLTTASQISEPIAEPSTAELVMLRRASVRRLLVLRERGECSTEHVRLVASYVKVHERTVWRWLDIAAKPAQPRGERPFILTPALRVRLAYYCGNAAALRRDLISEADDPAAVPSLRTLQRVIRRDLTPGERAARTHDVFLRRPPEHRNAVWEADHVQAPVEVLVAGRLVKPWITWFIDATYNAVCGAAVTAGFPSRESILVALRAAVLTRAPYGPVGGLPSRVRVDRGKDFLSRVLAQALGAFAVRLSDLPGYASYLKGTVEDMNGIVEKMFFATLPRYTHRQTLANGRPADPDAAALPFEIFVERFLKWVREWNTEHTSAVLGGRTPQQAWLQDPTPVFEPLEQDLLLYTLEDDLREWTITNSGVHWRGRYYVAVGMNGRARANTKVTVRYMPHHDHEIEVFRADTGEHLGRAELSHMASKELASTLMRARKQRERRLRSDLKAAAKLSAQRFAAVSVPHTPVALGALTHDEAVRELKSEITRFDREDLARLALPDLIPHDPTPPEWSAPARARRPDAQQEQP